MKKFFTFAMVLMVLVTALGFNVGSASARPADPRAPQVFLNSLYFNDLGVGEHVPAVTADGKNIYCVVKAEDLVRCEFPKKFAGQSVTLHLTVSDQTLIFYVNVPNLKEINYPV